MDDGKVIARVTIDGGVIEVTEKLVTLTGVRSDDGILIETDLQVALVGCKIGRAGK